MRLLLTCLVVLMGCSANAQALWRNFWTTNQNPRVTVAAGSNATVQASTVGVDQRIFTVNSVPPTNVAYAGFATNASNATNFWGTLDPTNLPTALNYISNYNGLGTNTTFYSNVTHLENALGTTITPRLWLTNGTAASLGAQQASPALMLGGQGWRSGNSTTMPVQMGMYVLPTQAASQNPSATLYFLVSVSNSAPSTVASIDSSGSLALNSGITASASIQTGSGSKYNFSGRSGIWSPANGDIQFLNDGQTAFTKLIIGKSTSDWLALKVEASTNNPTLSIRTGADGNYASLVASNVLTSGTMNPTNGVVFQGKYAFSTNFTAVESIQLYNCNGTNIVITLPNCTNTTPWKIYRFSQTNSWASFTLTNANGLQTIHNGIDLSYSVRSAKQTAVYHDGAHWWLAVPDQPNFPNAQFSCSTNIPLTLANTAYPVTFNSTDFNNSLGIALGAGTNGLLSKMWLTNSGVYEFGPSVVQSFNGNDTIRFWFRTFDTNVTASATPSKGQNGSIRVITVPFVISITQPTPVEIWAESDTTGETLQAEAASGNYPAAPCVICPVKMISHPWP